MKKQGKGKRKLKENIKKRKSYPLESDKEINNEESSGNKQNNKYPKYPKKIKVNKKQKERKLKNQNDSIIAASKVSYDYITKVMEQEVKKEKDEKKEEIKELKESDTNNSKIEDKTEEEKSKTNEIDDIFLSSLYILFEDYDEITIKRDNNKQYIINAYIKIENDKEIRFEIVYDNERDYFDYYPANKNFEFKDEDEPFNYDLDIPKEDFCLLIKNFKKFKIK